MIHFAGGAIAGFVVGWLAYGKGIRHAIKKDYVKIHVLQNDGSYLPMVADGRGGVKLDKSHLN